MSAVACGSGEVSSRCGQLLRVTTNRKQLVSAASSTAVTVKGRKVYKPNVAIALESTSPAIRICRFHYCLNGRERRLSRITTHSPSPSDDPVALAMRGT